MVTKTTRFASDQRAVSAVVGVVLMVAITVVMAAGAYILVKQVDVTPERAPTPVFQSDRSGVGGTILVMASTGAELLAENVRLDPDTCVLRDSAGAPKLVGPVTGGDYVDCPTDGAVAIVDDGSNTLLYTGKV